MEALTSMSGGWPLLLVSIVLLDVIVLFIVRYYLVPRHPLNVWYDKYGILAVLADVMSIAIGFAVARWLFATFFSTSGLIGFLLLLVGFQALHDILFYVGVIQTIPRGVNGLMDIFKDYARVSGPLIIPGDSLLMLGSAAIFTGLSYLPVSGQIFAGLVTAYTLPYILTTDAAKAQASV
jgi:hypothetical protein